MAQSVFFFSGLETGDGGEFLSLGTGASVQTGTVRTGGYALKNADTQASQLFNTLAATQTVLRFYLQVPAIPGSATLVAYENGGTAARLFINLNTTATLQVGDFGSSLGLVTINGTAVLSTGVWYRIELAYDLAAGGVVKVWVDGVLDINTTHSSNVSATTTKEYDLSGGTSPNEYFFDDIRVDQGGLTPVGAGQTIARQGKTGTPTYDTWTKNGAATAALCWSNTPFSAGTNCTKATSGAQTMLVGAFSASGSGTEGAQTIGASDTINACKTAIVGKTALASAGTIRRRIGGVDTDTAISLTTSDKYFDDGIWTTTTANLDTAEIGAVAGTVNLDTVEDCWLIVDYTPGSAAPSFGWFRPFSEPRLRLFNKGAVLPIATMVAGPVNPPASQPASDNANVRWHRPLSEPQRPKRDPRYESAFAAGPVSPPAIQPDIDNANVRWFQPFSLPQRFLRDPRYTAVLQTTGDTKGFYNQPAGDAANVNWYRPFLEPQRFLRDLRWAATLAAGPISEPAIQPDRDNANVRWFQPLSEPRREARFVARLADELAWPSGSIVVTPVVVTLDMWFAPFGTPTRRPVPAAVGSLDPPINTTSPAVSGWWRPLGEPQRFSRDPRFAATLAAGPVSPPAIQPTFDTANTNWYRPFSEPVRSRLALGTAEQQALQWNPQPITTPPPTVVVASWWVQLSTPVLRGGFPVFEQTSLIWSGQRPEPQAPAVRKRLVTQGGYNSTWHGTGPFTVQIGG